MYLIDSLLEHCNTFLALYCRFYLLFAFVDTKSVGNEKLLYITIICPPWLVE